MNTQTEQQIEEYLDRLCAQLTQLPREKQEEVRRETHAHLAALVTAGEMLGDAPTEAVVVALKQFGDPARIGRQIASECQRNRVYEREARFVVSLCLLPIAPWAAINAVYCLGFRVDKAFPNQSVLNFYRSEVLSFQLATLAISLATLFICWRAWSLRRWAWISISLLGFAGGIVLAALAYWSEPFTHGQAYWAELMMEWLLLTLGPAVVLTPALFLRWRALKPGA